MAAARATLGLVLLALAIAGATAGAGYPYRHLPALNRTYWPTLGLIALAFIVGFTTGPPSRWDILSWLGVLVFGPIMGFAFGRGFDPS